MTYRPSGAVPAGEPGGVFSVGSSWRAAQLHAKAGVVNVFQRLTEFTISAPSTEAGARRANEPAKMADWDGERVRGPEAADIEQAEGVEPLPTQLNLKEISPE